MGIGSTRKAHRTASGLLAGIRVIPTTTTHEIGDVPRNVKEAQTLGIKLESDLDDENGKDAAIK